MDFEALMDVVKNRCSVRIFKNDPVPEEMLNKIVEAASLAPTGNNTQPMEIVAVRNKAVIHEIETIIGEFFLPPMTQRFDAPAMLVILGDPGSAPHTPRALCGRKFSIRASASPSRTCSSPSPPWAWVACGKRFPLRRRSGLRNY